MNLRGQGDAALVTQVRPVGDEVWLILLVLLEITDMLSEVNVAQIAFGMSSILDYLLSLALDESIDESFSGARPPFPANYRTRSMTTGQLFRDDRTRQERRKYRKLS